MNVYHSNKKKQKTIRKYIDHIDTLNGNLFMMVYCTNKKKRRIVHPCLKASTASKKQLPTLNAKIRFVVVSMEKGNFKCISQQLVQKKNRKFDRSIHFWVFRFYRIRCPQTHIHTDDSHSAKTTNTTTTKYPLPNRSCPEMNHRGLVSTLFVSTCDRSFQDSVRWVI